MMLPGASLDSLFSILSPAACEALEHDQASRMPEDVLSESEVAEVFGEAGLNRFESVSQFEQSVGGLTATLASPLGFSVTTNSDSNLAWEKRSWFRAKPEQGKCWSRSARPRTATSSWMSVVTSGGLAMEWRFPGSWPHLESSLSSKRVFYFKLIR